MYSAHFAEWVRIHEPCAIGRASRWPHRKRALTQFLVNLETSLLGCCGAQGGESPPMRRKRRIEYQVNEPKTGRLSLTLKSTMESVAELEAVAEKLATEAGLNEDECFHVAMAVHEGAVNAVLHGNEYDPSKQVSASFENTGAALVIILSDQGKGLDPDSLPDPLAPENLLRGAGRGIFLIRSFMDEVRFRRLSPGTEITMIKRLVPPEQPGKSPQGTAPLL